MLLVFGAITIIYSLISGLLAVAYNDVLQFVLLMAGNTVFAVVLLKKAGGLTRPGIASLETRGDQLLQPFPGGDCPCSHDVTCLMSCRDCSLPGSPFAGEGWTAQRYMAARNEVACDSRSGAERRSCPGRAA